MRSQSTTDVYLVKWNYIGRDKLIHILKYNSTCMPKWGWVGGGGGGGGGLL